MPIRTQEELKQILNDRVRTAGVGGLTTALDLRIWGVDVIDSLYGLIGNISGTISGKADDSSVVHKTGNLTEVVDGDKTFAKLRANLLFVSSGLGAVENGKIELDASNLYYTTSGVRHQVLSKDAADLLYSGINHTHLDATIIASGFMSAADKIKLNSLSNSNSYGVFVDSAGSSIAATAPADAVTFRSMDDFISISVTRSDNINYLNYFFDRARLDYYYPSIDNVYTITEIDDIIAGLPTSGIFQPLEDQRLSSTNAVTFSGLDITTTGEDNAGINFAANTDGASIYFESTSNEAGDSNLIFESTDDVLADSGGLTEGFLFRKWNGNYDVDSVKIDLMRLNLSQFKYKTYDIYHEGNLPKLETDLSDFFIKNVNSAPTIAQTGASINVDGSVTAKKFTNNGLFDSDPVHNFASTYEVGGTLLNYHSNIRGLDFFPDVAFTDAPYSSWGVYGAHIISRVGAANTQNWTSSGGINGMVAAIRSANGATGTIYNANNINLSFSQNAPNLNYLNHRYIWIQTANYAMNPSKLNNEMGIAMAPMTLGLLSNIYMLTGSETSPGGNWGWYHSSSYNNYLGTGNTLINTTTDNGIDKLQVSGTATANEFKLYGTTDQVTNYERLRTYFAPKANPLLSYFTIDTENAGTGLKRRISFGQGDVPTLSTGTTPANYTLINTNTAIEGNILNYGISNTKTSLNASISAGVQAFVKTGYTLTPTLNQSLVGLRAVAFLSAANTSDWPAFTSFHPNITGTSSLVGQESGATGTITKVSAYFGTITGGGATIDQANILDLTFGHAGTINYGVGVRITDLNAATNNTFVLMNQGDSTIPPTGNWGVYNATAYNNYFGTGATLIGSNANNGVNNLQVNGTSYFNKTADDNTTPIATFSTNQTGVIPQQKLINVIFRGNEVATLTGNGFWNGAGMGNITSVTNGQINFPATGTLVQRALADGNPAFRVNQYLPGSGDIVDFIYNTTISRFKISSAGIIGINGTYLSAGQSLRVNAGGTAMEAFTPGSGTVTIDTDPTSGSGNAVSSGGVFTALSGKANLAGPQTFTGSQNFGALNAIGISVTSNLSNTGTTQLVGKASSAFTPVDPTDIANKSYIDGLDVNVVHKTGNETIGGAKTFNATIFGSQGIQLANTSIFTNGNMSTAGTITVTGKVVSGVTPTNVGDLTNKAYVDNSLLDKANLTGGNVFDGYQSIKNGNLQVNDALNMASSLLTTTLWGISPNKNLGAVILYNRLSDGTGSSFSNILSANHNQLNSTNELPASSGTLMNNVEVSSLLINYITISGANQNITGNFSAYNVFSSGAAPTIVLGASTVVGTGATISIVGNNQDGIITLTTGTGISAAGAVFTVTLNGFAYPYSCIPVLQVNTTASTNNVLLAISGVTSNSWQAYNGVIAGASSFIASSVYKWNYHNGGY